MLMIVFAYQQYQFKHSATTNHKMNVRVGEQVF